MLLHLPWSWQDAITPEVSLPLLEQLQDRMHYEYLHYTCFPDNDSIFRALDITPFENVQVVILGQDPYYTPGAAMWLSFSIANGIPIQPSLRNIFKELKSDIWVEKTDTDLTNWAIQWVLLLNSVLTVRSGEPASHAGYGWEQCTDIIIKTLSEKREGIVFVLWGNAAITKKNLIDEYRHCIIMSPHPSPFSAHRGFFGSRPFSRTNAYLGNHGKRPIVWD